jgi:sugar phosphate isomerase/epimerase
MLSRPKLGVDLWVMGERPLLEVAQVVAELGFDGVVLRGDVALEPEAVRTTLAAAGLGLYGVSPLPVDVVHGDTAVRQAALAYYRQLVAWAAAVGSPLLVMTVGGGGERPLDSEVAWEWLVTAVQQVADWAAEKGLRVAVAVQNRYEARLLHTGSAALDLLAAVARPNVGVALSAFHMNIEEQDAATTIQQVGERLALYTMADSNRRGIGRGHSKLGAHLWALEECGYAGPIVLDCLPPGVNFAQPVHTAQSWALLVGDLRESRSWF